MKSVIVQSPANIAFIKYMGKKATSGNIPANPSLSLTLSKLNTIVQLLWEPSDNLQIRFENKLPDDPRSEWSQLKESMVPKLTATQQQRVTDHYRNHCHSAFLGSDPKTFLGNFTLRTCNSFPMSSGIASSASSFSAYTFAFAALYEQHQDLQKLALVSQKGSGSSCRSFYGPWVEWSADGSIKPLLSQFKEVVHFVVLLDASLKSVSSAVAHHRVLTSDLWGHRPEVAVRRFEQTRQAHIMGDWKLLGELSFREAMHMHSLFHTSDEFFTYWRFETLQALQWYEFERQSQKDMPLFTMDAGPNLHFTIPLKHADYWRKKILHQFAQFQILEDQAGLGPEIIACNR